MTRKIQSQATDSQSHQDHINKVLDQFQRDWNSKITRDPKAPHNLENAVKELRQNLLGSQDEGSAKDGSEDKAAL